MLDLLKKRIMNIEKPQFQNMKNRSLVISTALFLFTFVLTAQMKEYTLEECILIALDKNISIKQSELDLESAEIDKADALGNFLPRINAQSQHIWNNGLSQNITNGLIENLTTQFSSFGGKYWVDTV
jgi:outer membrane protein